MRTKQSRWILVIALTLLPIYPAVASDITPPQLVDWSNTVGVDISNSDGQLKANFILSDESEIDLPKLILKSLSSTQMTAFATVRVIQKNGKLTSYEATAVVQKGQSPKTWEWVLYPLSDSLGNRSTIFGPGGSWITTANVYNSEYTLFTFRCERSVNNWNSAIAKLEAAEKKYPNYDNFAIFRLKYYRPLIKLEPTLCETKTSEFDENSGATLNTDLSEVIEVVTAKWQEAADKAASDKAIVDKLAADKTADSRKALINNLQAKLMALLIAKPDLKSLILKAQNSLNSIKVSSSSNDDYALKQQLLPIEKQIQSLEKLIILTCTKGKVTKKVTGTKPKCPSGYKKVA